MYDFSDHRRFMAGLPPISTPGPFKVYKRDRLMGTVPYFPVESTSGIFDVRPTDFVRERRDGETVLICKGMLGPGDWACIRGFIPADDLPESYSDTTAATAFDAFTEHGANRAQAISAVIANSLRKMMKGRT